MANSLIDFGITQPDVALQPFERARQQARQEQANQLAALQLRQAQRGEEEALAQREAYKSADPVKALFAAGLGTQAIAAAKAMQEQRAAQAKQIEEDLKLGRGIAERVYATGQAAEATAPGSGKEAMLSALKQFHGRGIDLSQDINEISSLADSQQALEHVFNRSQQLKDLSENLVVQLPGGGTAVEPKITRRGAPAAAPMPTPAAAPMAAPMASPAMPAGIPGQTPMTRNALAQAALPAPGMPTGAVPTPTGGRYYPPAMTPQQQAAEARAQRSLELQEQAANPEFQQRMAAAKTLGQQAAKDAATAVQALPKIIDQASQASRLIDEMIGQRDAQGNLVKGAKPHPGFESAVGAGFPGLKFVPGTETAGFVSRFDQLKGQSFLSAFESLKGGGSITNIEGDKATAAINRMSLSTNEREFIQAANELKQIINKGVERAQAKVDKARAQNSSLGSPAAPAAPAAGGVKFLGFE